MADSALYRLLSALASSFVMIDVYLDGGGDTFIWYLHNFNSLFAIVIGSMLNGMLVKSIGSVVASGAVFVVCSDMLICFETSAPRQ